MTKKSFPLLILSFAWMCIAQQPALASKYPQECATAPGAYKMADAVTKAHVDKIELRRETAGIMYTYTHFTILEYIKGSGEKNIHFRRLDGRADDMIITSEDGPVFAEGQEGYLFLTKENDLYFPACGYGLMDKLPDLTATEKKDEKYGPQK